MESCTYRYAINTNALHVFTTEAYQATTDATQDSGTGTYYLHVQALDSAGNESDVASVSAVLDNTIPTISGLSDDTTPARSKHWSWSCSGSESCTYRYAINTSSTHTFDSADAYEASTDATQDSGDGTYYIHVQAKDDADNESTVTSVSAILDNTGPTIAGLANDSAATQSKRWSWSCSGESCTYRYAINTSSTHSFNSTDSYGATSDATQDSGTGTYYLHVQAQDSLGNESTVVSVSAVLDNTAPTITGIANDFTSKRSKYWSWSCAGSESCTYRHAVNQNSSHVFTTEVYGATSDATQDSGTGTYYLHVQALDGAGNESAVTSVSAILDGTGPIIEGIASDNTPAQSKYWSWSCAGGESCTYRYVINQNSSHVFTTEAYGATNDATQDSGTGTYYLHVQAKDGASNESAINTVSAVLDNTAPTVTGLSDDTTPAKSKTWSWSCAGSESCTYRYAVNTSSTHTFDSADTYGATTDATQDSGTGTYYLHVQAKDDAGNESTTVSVSAVLDNTVPTISGISNDTTPAKSKYWSWSCAGSESCTYRYIINQDETHDFDTADAYGASTDATQDSGTGTYYLHVQALDGAGNESTVTSVSAVLDNTGPTIAGISNDTTPTKSKTWSWSCSGGESCTYRYVINQNVTHDFDSADAYGATSDATQDSGNGTYYLHVQAQDSLGNESTVLSVSAVLDNTVPAISGLSDDTTPTKSKYWSWSCAGSESCTYRYAINTSSTHAFDSTDAYEATTDATQDSGDGTYYIHVQALDRAGNESTVVSVSAILDNTVPTISGLSDDATPTKSKYWSWSCAGSESCTYRYAINTSSTHTFDSADAYGATSDVTQDSETGTYYLHVQALDSAGNESTVTSVSAVLDNTGPTIAGLSDDTTPTKSKTWSWSCAGGESCTYRYIINQDETHDFDTADAYGASTDATQDSGTGTYYLHVQAQDSLGNESTVVSVSAVLDNSAPAISGLSDDTTPTKSKYWSWSCAENESCTYRYVINQNVTHDFDSADAYGATSDATQDSGTGTYYLHVQALDSAGNESTVTSVSVVLDNTGPTIAGISNDTTPTKSKTWSWSCAGVESCTYRYIINQDETHDFDTADAYGASTGATQDSGTGTYYLHVQAQDSLGNESTVVSVSAVLDNSAPTIAGLSDDTTPTRSKYWSWSCAENESCTYRYVINTNSTHTFNSADAYGATSDATQDSGNGTYYIHVQALDSVGHESAVKSVSAVLDNIPPTPVASIVVSPVSPNLLDDTPEMAITLSSDVSAETTVKVYKDGSCDSEIASGTLSSGKDLSLTSSSLANGVYNFSAKSFDRAGNGSTCYHLASTYEIFISVSILAGGDYHTCAVLDSGGVKCWGRGLEGQLGQGNTDNLGDNSNEMGANLPVIDLGTGRSAKRILVGEYHTCALLDNNNMKCWGDNGYAQLGQGHGDGLGVGPNEMGDNLSAIDLGTGKKVKTMGASSKHNCAILNDNSVKCWGNNSRGILGQGNTNSIGGYSNQMGDNLSAVSLGAGRTAKAVTLGYWHTCAILDNNRVKCWGGGFYGRLGSGNTNDLGDGAGEMGDSLPYVDLGTGRTAKAIDAGIDHTCAILDNNRVKCWGRGSHGSLGQGNTNHLGDGAGEMGDNLSYVDLGTGRTAKAISSGSHHNCAILDNDDLKCWGWGGSGQLGYGNTNNLGDGANEMGDNLPAVSLGTGRTAKTVSAGNLHTCAMLDDDSVKCWGYGVQGQTGQGHTNTLGDGANEMGDDLPAVQLN